jgi:hypothetical protein
MLLRCCILLLYKARELWDRDFKIYLPDLGGAKGIRTPDLLHAMGNADVQ